jgi:hypothetical protein
MLALSDDECGDDGGSDDEDPQHGVLLTAYRLWLLAP